MPLPWALLSKTRMGDCTCWDVLAVGQHRGHGIVQVNPVDLPVGGLGRAEGGQEGSS